MSCIRYACSIKTTDPLCKSFLIWHNLLHLKEHGFVLYDMGELTDNRNVRAFKLSFGGVVHVYSGYIIQSKIRALLLGVQNGGSSNMNGGGLVISLDFELNWGVHDVFRYGQYNKTYMVYVKPCP